jgi:hypothetical protein
LTHTSIVLIHQCSHLMMSTLSIILIDMKTNTELSKSITRVVFVWFTWTLLQLWKSNCHKFWHYISFVQLYIENLLMDGFLLFVTSGRHYVNKKLCKCNENTLEDVLLQSKNLFENYQMFSCLIHCIIIVKYANVSTFCATNCSQDLFEQYWNS